MMESTERIGLKMMMESTERIGLPAISAAFCVGVGLAEAWMTESVGVLHTGCQTAPGTGLAGWMAAGAAMTGSAICLGVAAASRKRGSVPIAILFLLLGVSRALSEALSGGFGLRDATGGALEGIAAKSIERLKSAIGGIPFGKERTTAILQALLTGDRSGLDTGTVKSFRDAGAAHILALSGLHLGIVYGIVATVLRVLGNSRRARIVRAAAAIAFAGFYSLMTGAGPSITRAFLFITFNEILRLSPGRKRVPVNILCAALTVQLLAGPDVIKSLGFQLSYLSMAGITLLFPTMESWYPKNGKGRDPVRAIWVSAALSISCQIFTAPLIWIRFGTFPKYFLLTNLLALPLTEALILSGLASTALSAAGICPEFLAVATEKICDATVFTLETVASM